MIQSLRRGIEGRPQAHFSPFGQRVVGLSRVASRPILIKHGNLRGERNRHERRFGWKNTIALDGNAVVWRLVVRRGLGSYWGLLHACQYWK